MILKQTGSSNKYLNNDMSALLLDSQDNFWLGNTDGSLSLFDPKKKIVKETYRSDISFFGIWSLIEDKLNPHILCFETEDNGLFSFNKRTLKFKQYSHNPDNPNSISGNWVENIQQTKNGSLWIATISGLDLMDRDSGRFKHYSFHFDRILLLLGGRIADV